MQYKWAYKSSLLTKRHPLRGDFIIFSVVTRSMLHRKRGAIGKVKLIMRGVKEELKAMSFIIFSRVWLRTLLKRSCKQMLAGFYISRL